MQILTIFKEKKNWCIFPYYLELLKLSNMLNWENLMKINKIIRYTSSYKKSSYIIIMSMILELIKGKQSNMRLDILSSKNFDQVNNLFGWRRKFYILNKDYIKHLGFVCQDVLDT